MNSASNNLDDLIGQRRTPIALWRSADDVETWTADAFRWQVALISEALRRRGLRPGDTAAILAPTSLPMLALIMAVWRCQASISILPHDSLRTAPESAASKLARMLEMLCPALLVVDASSCHLSEFAGTCSIASADLQGLADTSSGPTSDSGYVDPEGIAVIQWTSGSTGSPKGIPLTHRQVALNCAAIAEVAAMTSDDHVVTWLPLHHDMGLSAMTLSLYSGATLTAIPTERFVRSPMTWLEAISQVRGTVSPSPAFAYALLARRAKLLQRSGLDLSCWRYAWVGAEPVFPEVLDAFSESTRSLHFAPSALKPSYGLAEAVVAVSSPAAYEAYGEIRIDRGQMRRGLAVVSDAADTVRMVSNGKALRGQSIAIGTAVGQWLPERTIGTVWLSGPCVARGYLHRQDHERFSADGWFDSGDLGFLHQGELYITGRSKDLIIRGGVNISPQEIEGVISNLLDLRPGQVAAFGNISHERAREEVCVVIGRDITACDRAALTAHIAKAVADSVAVQLDHIAFAPARSLPKTTSGKIQRGLVRALYLNGAFSN